MTRWTVQDEINLIEWVDAMGFRIVYLPQLEQWGFLHSSKPKEINAGFEKLVDLKQHLVNLKGEKRNVQVVSEGDFQRAVEQRALERNRGIRKHH